MKNIINEKTLPIYVQNDINSLKEAIKNNDTLLISDLWCELYGSINSAMWDNEISKEVADYLREKYL